MYNLKILVNDIIKTLLEPYKNQEFLFIKQCGDPIDHLIIWGITPPINGMSIRACYKMKPENSLIVVVIWGVPDLARETRYIEVAPYTTWQFPPT